MTILSLGRTPGQSPGALVLDNKRTIQFIELYKLNDPSIDDPINLNNNIDTSYIKECLNIYESNQRGRNEETKREKINELQREVISFL